MRLQSIMCTASSDKLQSPASVGDVFKKWSDWSDGDSLFCILFKHTDAKVKVKKKSKVFLCVCVCMFPPLSKSLWCWCLVGLLNFLIWNSMKEVWTPMRPWWQKL